MYIFIFSNELCFFNMRLHANEAEGILFFIVLFTKRCGRPATIACCEGLTYKANIIRINLGVQLPDMKMTVQAFHDAVAFERKEKALGRYDVDTEPDNDGVMEMWFGHTDYDKVTDEDIFKVNGSSNLRYVFGIIFTPFICSFIQGIQVYDRRSRRR